MLLTTSPPDPFKRRNRTCPRRREMLGRGTCTAAGSLGRGAVPAAPVSGGKRAGRTSGQQAWALYLGEWGLPGRWSNSLETTQVIGTEPGRKLTSANTFCPPCEIHPLRRNQTITRSTGHGLFKANTSSRVTETRISGPQTPSPLGDVKRRSGLDGW